MVEACTGAEGVAQPLESSLKESAENTNNILIRYDEAVSCSRDMAMGQAAIVREHALAPFV